MTTRILALVAVLVAACALTARAEEARPSPVETVVRSLVAADDATLDRALTSADALRREAAAAVLERRGAATAAQVEELTAAAGDDVVAVRLAATRALGALGDAALPAAARLERLAGWATDVRQRHLAALALARIPAARENFYRLFVDSSSAESAATGLAALGAEGREALVLLTRAPAWRTRRFAVRALPGVQDSATHADVLAALERLIRDESPAVRVATLEILPRTVGGWMLTLDDVARVFGQSAQSGEPGERAAVLVALADVRLPGDAPASDVQTAAALAATGSPSPADRLTGVRLAHASGSIAEPLLLSLARLACSDGIAEAREAAATLRHAAAVAPLPASVADALRPALRNERARVATEAAAAMARGGFDAPELAAPLTRLLYARSWGGWKGNGMARPPHGWSHSRRNLRAGGPRRLELPAVPLLALDDVIPLLRMHPAATADALRPFLDGEFSATRANAAWMAAETLPDETATGLLLPFLDDPISSVRIVAGLRLVRIDTETERVVRLFVAALLADRPYRDEVIRDGVHDDPEAPLLWADELVAELHRAPRAAVSALVAGYDALPDTDGEGGGVDHDWTWAEPSGAAHVPAILDALGPQGAHLLVDQLLEGPRAKRDVVAHLLVRARSQSLLVRERLLGRRDDPDLGDIVRRILGD